MSEVKEFEDRQICKLNGAKSLIELQDNLKQDEKSQRVHGDFSLIKVVMIDYSTPNHTYVSCNTAPETISYIKEVSLQCRPTFAYEESKIFGDADKSGESAVTKLSIKRIATDQNGAKRNNPWYITVENGKGKKAQSKTGGIYIQSGSYRKEKSVSIFCTDAEMYKLMLKGENYIKNFEKKVVVKRCLKDFANAFGTWIMTNIKSLLPSKNSKENQNVA